MVYPGFQYLKNQPRSGFSQMAELVCPITLAEAVILNFCQNSGKAKGYNSWADIFITTKQTNNNPLYFSYHFPILTSQPFSSCDHVLSLDFCLLDISEIIRKDVAFCD